MKFRFSFFLQIIFSIFLLTNFYARADDINNSSSDQQGMQIVISLNHFEEGKVYQSEGKFEEALVAYDLAIKNQPDPGFITDVYLYKGLVLDKLGKSEEALAALDLGIKYNSSNPGSYFVKAMILSNLGIFKEAVENFDLAIKHNSNFGDAYHYKAHALESMGNKDEAKKFYDKAKILCKEHQCLTPVCEDH